MVPFERPDPAEARFYIEDKPTGSIDPPAAGILACLEQQTLKRV